MRVFLFGHGLVTKPCLTLVTVAHQAPLCVGFPRPEYCSRLPFPSPGDLPNPGIKPASPALAGGFFTTEPPGKPKYVAKVWKRLGHAQATLRRRKRGPPTGLTPAPATDSSTLAWRIPWTEGSGGLQSKGSKRVRHGLVTKQLVI